MVIIQKRKEKKKKHCGASTREKLDVNYTMQRRVNKLQRSKKTMKSKNLHLNQGGSDPETSQQGQVLLNNLTLKCIKEQ